MRIALCLSGQPRSVVPGHEYIKKNLLDCNDVTVFIHTWSLSSPDNKDLPCQEAMIYDPAAILIERPITPDLTRYRRVPPPSPGWDVRTPAYNTYCQLYSIQKANNLKVEYEVQNDMEFDWVVRSRFDFALNTQIPFKDLDSKKLYIPNCRVVPARDFGSDQFAWSSSDNMDNYSNTLDWLPVYYTHGITMISEEMMSETWKQSNLTGENLVYRDMNHPFPPGKFNGTPHSLIRDDYKAWR